MTNRRTTSNYLDYEIDLHRKSDGPPVQIPRQEDALLHPQTGLHLPQYFEERERLKRERGSIPSWILGRAFKILVVACVLLLALAPIALKLERNAVELKRTRSHFKGYYLLNPEISNMKNIDSMEHYCHASFPSALEELKYKMPGGYEFVSSQIITRGGDRSPYNVLPNEGNVTWDCDMSVPQVGEESVTFHMTRVKDEEIPQNPLLWKGNCSPGDLTRKGATQLHMLGKVIGAVYNQFLEISPREISVRSTDTQHTLESAKYFVMGLMENAYVGGPVNIMTGVSDDMDILNPLTTKNCPAIQNQTSKLFNSPEWRKHMKDHVNLMKSLTEITDIDMKDDTLKNWYSDFGFFHDSIHARFCNDKPLPCSREDPTSCTTTEMARELFEAGSFELVQKSGQSLWPLLPRLQVGALLKEIVHAMERHVHFNEATKDWQKGHKSHERSSDEYEIQGQTIVAPARINLYSAHGATIAALLAAFQAEDWVKWPPYASNMLLELWKRTDSPQFAIRLLYNGRLMHLPFCSEQIGADGYLCPFSFFLEFFKENLVPENLQEECNK